MGLRKFPYASTEQGVAMLSGVLNSKRAIRNVFQEIQKLAVPPTKPKQAIGFSSNIGDG